MTQETPPEESGTNPGAQSATTNGGPSVTRRMALGLLGLGVLAGGETTAARADVGGGPDSDELAHLMRPVYEGPESELPDPGVEGRRFTVTDSGGTYPQWTELRDTGSAWEPISFGAGSLNTGSLLTDSDESLFVHQETIDLGSNTSLSIVPDHEKPVTILAFSDLTEPTNDPVDFFIRINNDDADNYFYRQTDNSRATNETEWMVGSVSRHDRLPPSGTVVIEELSADRTNITSNFGADEVDPQVGLRHGTFLGNPVNSIQVEWDSAVDWSGTLLVLGADYKVMV